MKQDILLLNDHTWYAIYSKEQAQQIIKEHTWQTPCERGGLYISVNDYEEYIKIKNNKEITISVFSS